MGFVDDALNLLDNIDLKLNLGLSSNRNDRLLCANALYSLTLDHTRAICNLIRIESCPSAFALQRIAFESYIRGAWIHHCATQEQIETFLKNKGIKDKPNDRKEIKFGDLVQQTETASNLPTYLSAIKTKSWAALNSYTHSGIHQISRYIADNIITPNFADEEKYEALEFSLILSCFSLAGILDLYNIESSELIANEIIEAVIHWKETYQSTS